MYHAAADFALRRGMAILNMGLGEFRFADYSWLSPWAQHSMFGIRLFAEGIDPAAVHHHHLYQILRMAPERASWDQPATADDVMEACITRSV